ncbi:MAG: hypothetical protein IPK79_00295 [Vampirovibrionales bacterium]|nr:hypothetical protein [Vampirovibrionales bacterium]
MPPMKISCKPNTLFVYDRWIAVDALIQRAYLLDKFGAEFYQLPTLTAGSPASDLMDCALPLESRQRGGHQYWAASWCDVQSMQLQQDASAWVRQFSDADGVSYLHDKARRINTTAGRDKAYNMPIHLRTLDECVWYVVGDIAEIDRLLNGYIHAIGKKAAYGNGALQEYATGQYWRVEAWPHDWSERDAEGRLTRGLPATTLDNAEIYGVRPPYFVRANQILMEMPA